jgi:hypothetical protein
VYSFCTLSKKALTSGVFTSNCSSRCFERLDLQGGTQ